MLEQWYHWIRGHHAIELMTLMAGFMLLDGPRYAVARVIVLTIDVTGHAWRTLNGTLRTRFTHCPSLTVIVAGYNEGETIHGTLESLYGSYPRLELVVVDDGSTDNMSGVANKFAETHEDVTVLARPHRGGKSSAMNFGLNYSRGEIIVCVDADSSLGPNALWEIVQPFQDPRVGVVSASILPRNPWDNLVTWMQSYEYMHSIVVGREVARRLGVLAIASGAFAAIRREAMDRSGAWDVGPPEDFDLTLRVLRSGYRIEFTRFAQCFTDMPTTLWSLIKQRLRWEQGAVVRNYMRKHAGMFQFWKKNHSLSNAMVATEAFITQFACPIALFFYSIYLAFTFSNDLLNVSLTIYVLAALFELLQVCTLAYYSDNLRRDSLICAVFPLMPFYQIMMLGVRFVSNLQELFFRASFQDNYVPQHVREATWKW
ncbi:Poly-beta-1,6-N-acetyl-D-glucosamine synthase [Symmachiella macrocystis]|uniref:Poly-beta-1,6-N-acetyl-D-glucosamine synthase n=1 Tax=Symmachiella macrocystis TaxID=2527985 RepID=A0A5C6B0Z8_9PLAN|nr:glycosyltransferase [Symmachiella macrocystis]TWU05129.1 Poly-beta-1,6-N-acetyl-D-glucosamine synthase [Symmachiella macrocystis]